MPSSLYVPILLGGMILTGSSNSVWSKWQDMQCVENCSDPNVANRILYEQPVWQTLQMFLGEMLCFLPVIYARFASGSPSVQLELTDEVDLGDSKRPSDDLSGWNFLVFWIPAICDLAGTTLMNIGLLYTPVSIYQMTRGALVLFVGIFSVLFLRRRLWLYQWISLIIVMTGVGLVGYCGSLVKNAIAVTPLHNLLGEKMDKAAPLLEDPPVANVVLGVFFVLFAQVFTATQFVVEERIMERYSVPPLVAVGFEGFFGAISVILAIPIISLPSVTAVSPFFDIPRGWYQMINNPPVMWSGIAIAISISFFNYFGLSVTRHVSATARSLTDTCRTLFIWLISLGLGWEKILFPMSLLQVAGFSLLVYGTFLFNNLVNVPSCLPKPVLRAATPLFVIDSDEEAGERDSLLVTPTTVLDETAALPADLGQSGYDVVPEDRQHLHHSRGHQ